jgi:Uma2 family endonuclease
MSAVIRPKPITAEEFERFDPEWRYDLIRGELRPMPPMPGAEHGVVTFELSLEVGTFVRQHELGRCFAAKTRFTIERDPDTAIAPDFAFVAKHRLPERLPGGFLEMAPDLVLEVRSPSDRKKGVEEKVRRWLSAGVRLVWELDPKTRILTIYRPGQEPRKLGIDDTLTGEDVLPGFTLPLRRLFER